ncbi:MAG TPA: outer membrane protein assembly factor BamD [Terriglobia bacterium]|nr:outer membrane protein assembly factor BamD [Terriglobia bacterium]
MENRPLCKAGNLESFARRPWRLAGAGYRLAAIVLLAFAITALPSCVLLKQQIGQNNLLPSGQQPDKILYERSVAEIDHGRYDVGRLTLQTLLNTYPDSEFLAKAKLAIANSYFRQGGVAGLTESESEYKDFITFFPTAPEAPMAQFRVGMAHFRMMGKPDRDLTEARLAEAEIKEFLLKYPDSPLMPRVKARLREVQEVLAEGKFNIAQFYFEKHADPAARSRLQEIVNRYPNFSMADRACWYLAKTYQRMKKPQSAIPLYDRILTDYPLSPLAPDAKQQLADLHQPIPQPTLATLARAHADAAKDVQPTILHRIMGTFSSAPNLQATRRGPVILGHETPVVEMAGNPGPGAASGNAIAVEPVGESNLKNGKAADPKQAKADTTGKNGGTDAKEKLKSDSNSQTEAAAHPKKKKGPFHLLKKVIKPF